MAEIRREEESVHTGLPRNKRKTRTLDTAGCGTQDYLFSHGFGLGGRTIVS